MKRYLVKFALQVLFPLFATSGSACAREVKEPAVAGTFYPGEKSALQQMVDGFVASGVPAGNGRLLALVAPHAGYIYSGGVAGAGYARIKGEKIRTVILLGPAHHVPVSGAAVYPGDAVRTPLGEVPVDRDLAKSLTSPTEDVAAAAAPFAREHSLEVQFPFLQRTLGEFRVVPVLIGSPTRASYRFLSERIGEILLKNRDALLVISTDFSHYHDASTAAALDTKGIDAILRLSGAELEQGMSRRDCELCGGFPVIYGMAAARKAGATEAELFKRGDSGDAAGDRKSVVGYASIGIYRRSLAPEARKTILDLARQGATAAVFGKPLPKWQGSDPRLRAEGAAFVTLKKADGSLRGCIGNILPVMPLADSVLSNGAAAAIRDSRFRPVTPEEFPGLSLEVTVLSPLEPLQDVNGIRIGEHGLYLEAEGRSSVFLPQVPVEQGWDRETYLRQLALKAGLPADGWKKGKLSIFTAEIVH